jgi:6-phosphogluconolactonase (cycloisomerase 2 family)
MNSNIYALVGNWSSEPGKKGLSVYRYDPENAGLEWLHTAFTDVAVGQQYIDAERNIVYITDERASRRGETGGGGYVMAIQIDGQTGEPALLNEKESLASNPSYIRVDHMKQYAVVAHHSGRNHITRIVRNKNGGFASKTLFDDTALALFRLNDDGSFGEVCDVMITPGHGVSGPHIISHQHSVLSDPGDTLWIVCDKGTDRIYSCRLDRIHGKLVLLRETIVETGNAPRYGVFHPTLPIFYENNETNPVLFAFQYNTGSGELLRIGALPLREGFEKNADSAKINASDIVIHPDGRRLYVSLRGLNTVVAVDLDEKGAMQVKQHINCGGKNPRGLCLSPDARYLFVTNTESGSITAFAVSRDGTLTATGKEAKAPCPGNMKFLVAQKRA